MVNDDVSNHPLNVKATARARDQLAARMASLTKDRRTGKLIVSVGMNDGIATSVEIEVREHERVRPD